MTTATKNTTADLYASVTESIIAKLKEGTRPWVKPWSADHCLGGFPLRHDGTPYRGVNTLILWVEAEKKGFSSPYWMTFEQAKKMKACVKKGEKSSRVVFWDKFAKEDDDGNKKFIPFVKNYCVFNAEQIDGLPDRYKVEEATPQISDEERNGKAEEFVKSTQANIRHSGAAAYYSPQIDVITMPPFVSFKTPVSYYATLFHELAHWSGAEKRLDRNLTGNRKTDNYGIEELVAEIAASFLSITLGLAPEVRDDHASYIDGWIKIMQQDHKIVFTAAAKAQQAADYLLKLHASE